MIKVEDLFEVVYGVNLEYNKMTTEKYGVPFVSRCSSNSGVQGFVRKKAGIEMNPAYTLSVATGGSVLESFLQEMPYCSGRDLYYLQPKVSLTKQQMLYYCMVVRSNRYKYSYGRQANKTLGQILIPHPTDLPDWVNESQLPEPPSKNSYSERKVSLFSGEWRSFRCKEIFSIEKGRAPRLCNLEDGPIPCVTCSEKNNGSNKSVKVDMSLTNESDALTFLFFSDQSLCMPSQKCSNF